MAQIVWTEPAFEQLEEIAEYIAVDNLSAASDLAERALATVKRLEQFPHSGRELPELPVSIYREVICTPCRVIYRCHGDAIIVLHVLRQECELRRYLLGGIHD